MPGKAFFDTNVLLYALAEADDRSGKAEALLAAGGVISVQVLNEFIAVARRKLEMSWGETFQVCTGLVLLCLIAPSDARAQRVSFAVVPNSGGLSLIDTFTGVVGLTSVSSDQPVIVERSQYWPHGNWYEAHNSAGETSAGTKWALAAGRVGGQNHAQTYILLANSGTQPAQVTATFLREDGTAVVKTFTVAPTSRLNIAVTGPASDVPELAGENFGTSIVSTQPIIVERSMYTDAKGVTWAAGTNVTATRLPF